MQFWCITHPTEEVVLCQAPLYHFSELSWVIFFILMVVEIETWATPDSDCLE